VRISLSVRPSVLADALLSGEVVPHGLELDVFRPETIDANSRAMLELRYDVGEMSIATFVRAVERGLPLVALPVFTSGRHFVHSGICLARGSDVAGVDDLASRRIGLPQYWISSCVWQRLVLQQMHGIRPEDVRWVSVEPERFEEVGLPSGVELRLEEGRSLAELMAEGAIDACLVQGARAIPPDIAAVSTPAYPDCVAAEREYYEKTGVLPVMHLTVARRSLVEEHPEAVPALLDAYRRSKEIGERRLDARWPLPPAGHRIEALRELVGGDPFAFGISPNRRAIEAFLATALDQGLVSRPVGLDELFVAELPPEYR
jgi:4,5-dihydroxyphthalate decarboxylase